MYIEGRRDGWKKPYFNWFVEPMGGFPHLNLLVGLDGMEGLCVHERLSVRETDNLWMYDWWHLPCSKRLHIKRRGETAILVVMARKSLSLTRPQCWFWIPYVNKGRMLSVSRRLSTNGGVSNLSCPCAAWDVDLREEREQRRWKVKVSSDCVF